MKWLLATLWILAGGAITAGTYWMFLITPVSTALALAATALIAIVVLALLGLTANGAIEIWRHGWSIAGIKRALQRIPAVVPAALIVLVLWWLTSRAELWFAERTGPISAWFIAQFGWGDMSWLFTSISYLASWIRWVVGALLALSLLAGVLSLGWPALSSRGWITRALRVRGLAVATAAFVVLVALPWTFVVPWRPSWLPPTTIETAFIAAKLGIVAIMSALAMVLTIREASPASPSSPASPVSPVSPAL